MTTYAKSCAYDGPGLSLTTLIIKLVLDLTLTPNTKSCE